MNDNYNEITDNLDYYLNTREGLEKLISDAKDKNKKYVAELFKYYKTSRDIIWLSSYCNLCIYYQSNNKRMRCILNDARLVKPFYGKVIWEIIINDKNIEEYMPKDIDWDKKRLDLEDRIVDIAVKHINGGRPYPCFKLKV